MSFQETTRVLTEAAINGKVDYLRGLKENAEPTLDALAGYEDEARLAYTGGLTETASPDEGMAE